ncbi:heme ABC transporter ATP-binding protein [Anaeromicrobium sediminis]|uniref:Heme ABC transporter ATP-binding protein n=2 Tax=Anaeromicrobium sediminis TaxID=1478221 RepID=A0A267MMJ0_9FIRM|nr:heme ABC transporter ATP-binding protein [Anaeromicrobium sediminis]
MNKEGGIKVSGSKQFNEVVVEMKQIVKKFGDFVANDHIDLTVHKGEVHALLGENGAGKSTLMNILYGLYTPTSGEIHINGKYVDIKNPNIAIENGIGMVHQHFMLVKPFTVAENIVLGMEPTGFANKINMDKATKDVTAISEKYGLHVDPNAKIEDISVGMQQRVEILKALYRGAEILIFDEPTAVLTPQEIKEFIQIIRNLTNEGKSIILITHKLKEIKETSDFCTIIRRGKRIGTVNVEESTEDDLASMMVGREVSFEVEKEERKAKGEVLKVENLVVQDHRGISVVDGLNLSVRAGEILGIAGVDGNGQSELIEAITGLRPSKSGKVLINGNDVTNKTPREVFESGISNIPEDRQKHGLVLDFTVEENMVLENYRKEPFSKGVRIMEEEVNSFAKELMEKFDVRPRNEKNKARALSGGNQQKVIIAREVTNDPDLLIATQPTRGLDVGAIEFVHKSLVEQRDKDKAVLLVSFELDEIMSVSDRIAVIYEGKIVDVVNAKETNENELGLMMAGGGKVEE